MSDNTETTPASSDAPAQTVRRRSFYLRLGAVIILLYLVGVYVIIPRVWKRDVRRHPQLFDAPRITHTPDGIPGDPVNVALLGSESNVIHAMIKTRWYPADPITFHSSLRIALDSVLRRPDDDAPVSTLELFGRKQDLAFEQPVGDSPRQRHHVRFWHWDRLQDGREVWFGAMTFDERVGLSHTTGQVTHHIGPDIDAERDRSLSANCSKPADAEVYWMPGFQQLQGRNGGGDPWHTDGRLGVAVLTAPPTRLRCRQASHVPLIRALDATSLMIRGLVELGAVEAALAFDGPLNSMPFSWNETRGKRQKYGGKKMSFRPPYFLPLSFCQIRRETRRRAALAKGRT